MSSAVIGVCVCACICTDASKQGFAFAVREGCRELASEVRRVSERTRFKRSSRSIRARSRGVPSRQMSLWNVQVRTKMRCRLPDERGARTSLRCRCNFWIPRNKDFLHAVVSSAVKTSKVFEARSILHSVQCAESKYPPGHLLIVSDSLALVLAPCKGRSKHVTLRSVMRRIFASWFPGRFYLIVQVDTVRPELFRKG